MTKVRELRVGEQRIGWELKRTRRRTIGFLVGADGLVVSAPRWVGLSDIEAALAEKSAWIARKFAEGRERAARLEAARVHWRDGAELPFLGEPVTLLLDERAAGAVLDAERRRLHLPLPAQARPDAIGAAARGWLQRQARRLFEQRCAEYAPRLGVRMTRLSLSSAATRWGSAGADGAIRLNWRLVHFALPLIDYVVVHELAHLREMNHGPRFWATVAAALPGYAAARAQLRDAVAPQLD